jgi:hypothetical protein
MGDHDYYQLATHCFAAFGFLKVAVYILKLTMEEGIEVLRKARAVYLEMRSWETEKPQRRLPESSMGATEVHPPGTGQ